MALILTTLTAGTLGEQVLHAEAAAHRRPLVRAIGLRSCEVPAPGDLPHSGRPPAELSGASGPPRLLPRAGLFAVSACLSERAPRTRTWNRRFWRPVPFDSRSMSASHSR